MRKTIALIFFFGCLFISTESNAQNFNQAVGLRLGYPMSISYKQFLNESNAFEVYAGTRGSGVGWRWFSVSGAYQIHKPIESVEGLDYYYGGGASVFFWSFDFDTDASNTAIGLQGYLGLSYTFKDSPINISLDWIPTFLLSGYSNGFGADYGSLAVRYILK